MLRASRPMSPAIERYYRAARQAGCPLDQALNFSRAACILQPKQLLASSAARLCDHTDGPTEIGYGGARGGGKSHWMGADDCMRFAGLKCLLLRKVGGSAKEGFEDLLSGTLGQIGGKYIPSSNVWLAPNGSKIKLGHFQNERDIDKYLGLGYDVIGIEEATTLSESKMRMIRTCNRTTKRGWRARIYSTTNPGGIGHSWYKERFIVPFRAKLLGKTRFVPALLEDNCYFEPEYRANLEELTGWQREAWLNGDWDIAIGKFFSCWRHDKHVVEPFPIPHDWRLWMSFDYGFGHDTAVYLFAKSNDGQIFVIAEHGERKKLPRQHADAMQAMLDRHGIAKHRIEAIVAGGDCWNKDRDGGSIEQDYANLGWSFDRANDDRINGAAAIARRIGEYNRDGTISQLPSVFVWNTCPKLIECMPNMEHDPQRPEDVLKVDMDQDGRGGDDAYDSFRYGLMFAEQATRSLTAIVSPFAGRGR
jgi:phage terminase large subunit